MSCECCCVVYCCWTCVCVSFCRSTWKRTMRTYCCRSATRRGRWASLWSAFTNAPAAQRSSTPKSACVSFLFFSFLNLEHCTRSRCTVFAILRVDCAYFERWNSTQIHSVGQKINDVCPTSTGKTPHVAFRCCSIALKTVKIFRSIQQNRRKWFSFDAQRENQWKRFSSTIVSSTIMSARGFHAPVKKWQFRIGRLRQNKQTKREFETRVILQKPYEFKFRAIEIDALACAMRRITYYWLCTNKTRAHGITRIDVSSEHIRQNVFLIQIRMIERFHFLRSYVSSQLYFKSISNL